MVALPCGHLLCKADFERLGGKFNHDAVDESSESEVEEEVDPKLFELFVIRG